MPENNYAFRYSWLKYFKARTEVDWKEYLEAFVLEYGAHHEYSLTSYKSSICSFPDSSSRAVVTIENFISFGRMSENSPAIEVYQAFQSVCDPGTQVLITGMLIEGNENDGPPIWELEVVTPLLGLKVRRTSKSSGISRYFLCSPTTICVLLR